MRNGQARLAGISPESRPGFAPQLIDFPARVNTLDGILGEYLTRYTTSQSRATTGKDLRHLFATTGANHPAELTIPAIVAWCQAPNGGNPANNTVRGRASTVRAFLRWCRRQGLAALDPEDELASLRRSYPATYGKVQSVHPARRLSYEEAFSRLLGACQDGTPVGMRDELVCRLGLLGLRCEEIVNAIWRWVLPDESLVVQGKGHRTRVVLPGTATTELLAHWRRRYERELGRAVIDSDPLLCAGQPGHGWRNVRWGHRLTTTWTVRRIVTRRAEAAALGHLAPHDLRRTCAQLLREARTPDGAPRFDLRDIQKVLGHASPETTERVYLNPADRDAQERAAVILD